MGDRIGLWWDLGLVLVVDCDMRYIERKGFGEIFLVGFGAEEEKGMRIGLFVGFWVVGYDIMDKWPLRLYGFESLKK